MKGGPIHWMPASKNAPRKKYPGVVGYALLSIAVFEVMEIAVLMRLPD